MPKAGRHLVIASRGSRGSRTTWRPGRLTTGILVLILVASVKFAYVHERIQLPDVNRPTLDSQFHDQWARGIAFGYWSPELAKLQHEPYFRAPLYPYFVATVYRGLGDKPGTLFAIQALLGAITVTLMYLFCRATFDARVAWVAVILQLGYWPFTYHEAERMLPALNLPLDMLLLTLVLAAGRNGKYRYTCMAGFAAGLSAITRPSILITLPLAALWLAFRVGANRRQHVTRRCHSTMEQFHWEPQDVSRGVRSGNSRRPCRPLPRNFWAEMCVC